uniref:Centromere/kinetochore protein zw10 N-terminal domain-containing protein n=1 Tax=Neogobius melanostomus TaxID=47308 RepID=A0A8C6SPD9_9GOBI
LLSVVTEINSELEKEDLSGKICKLSRKVQDTKVEVCDFMKGKYKDFLPNLQDSEELMEQVGELSRELDTLKNCIDVYSCYTKQDANCYQAKYKEGSKNILVVMNYVMN